MKSDTSSNQQANPQGSRTIKIKIAKTAYVGYLYADGHAVVLHREHHSKAGEVEWAEIWEKLDTECAFEGRIVFHDVTRDLRFKLACEAHRIYANAPSLTHGSENTKRKGISVAAFTIEFKDGTELDWVRTPLFLAIANFPPSTL
jgi:hypothetical protein